MTSTDSDGARPTMTMASAPARQGEAAAGERVVEPIGQRAAADDGELGGCRQRTADQRTEGEDDRRLGGKWLRRRATLVQEEACAEAAAADAGAQDAVVQRH